MAATLCSMSRAEVERDIQRHLDCLNAPFGSFALADTPPKDGEGIVVFGDGPEFEWVQLRDHETHETRRIDGAEVVFLMLEHLTLTIARREEEQTRTQVTGLKSKLAKLFGRGDFGVGFDDYSRGTWIEAHARLMGALNAGWGTRVALHHEITLKKFPLTEMERKNQRRLDLSKYGVD